MRDENGDWIPSKECLQVCEEYAVTTKAFSIALILAKTKSMEPADYDRAHRTLKCLHNHRPFR